MNVCQNAWFKCHGIKITFFNYKKMFMDGGHELWGCEWDFSNFTITSLCKCIRDLEVPILGIYGNLLYNIRGLEHPLHESQLQCQSYE